MEKYLKKLPFYDHKWFNFMRFLVRHFFEDDCQQKAASLTYTTLLSLVPMITVLLMILSTVPALESVREQISQLIYDNLLPQSSMQVSDYISEFAEKSSNLTSIGAIVLFITTIMTLTTIERAFNKIWRVEDRSGGLKSILRYWTIITIGPIILGTAFVLSGAVQSFSLLNKEVGGYGIDWTFWLQVFSFSVTAAGFIGMYWFIPKAKVPFKNAAVAGIIVVILFELLKRIFGSVMADFTSYEAIYGAFAALPIFLLWIFLSWNLILLGVEISYTMTIFAADEVYPRHPLLSLLDMLNLIYDRHQKGETVDEDELRNVLGRKELPKWYTYINYLKDSDLITLTEDEKYVLKTDLHGMTLWDFYRTLPYPLPIKDELDQMKPEAREPWLDLLVTRFLDTEKYAKQELDVPLSVIFDNSRPRPKVKDDHPIAAPEDPKYRQRFNPDAYTPNSKNKEKFEPRAYDPKADKVDDDQDDNEALIPDGEPNSARGHCALNADVGGADSHTAQITPSSAPESTSDAATSKGALSRKGRLLASLTSHAEPIITEDDNPNK